MALTDDERRAYLLGRLNDSEVERLEIRLLAEEELLDDLCAAEDDLIDDFARGRLSNDDRDRFVERFGDEPGRVSFARALAQRVSTAPRSRAASWIMPAAAAVLLAIGGAWWLRSEPSPAPSPSPVASTAVPAPVTPPFVALVALGSSRAAQAPATIDVPAAAEVIRLRIRLNPADRHPAYAIEIRSAADATVWRAGDLRASPDNGDLFVDGDVPASALPAGDYEIGVRAAGADLGFINVRVKRKP